MAQIVNKSKLPKITRNQKFEQSQKDKGLRKITVWCPEFAIDDLKDLMTYIVKEYTAKPRRELIPYMFRDLGNGRIGKPK